MARGRDGSTNPCSSTTGSWSSGLLQCRDTSSPAPPSSYKPSSRAIHRWGSGSSTDLDGSTTPAWSLHLCRSEPISSTSVLSSALFLKVLLQERRRLNDSSPSAWVLELWRSIPYVSAPWQLKVSGTRLHCWLVSRRALQRTSKRNRPHGRSKTTWRD